jgi:Lsr2
MAQKVQTLYIDDIDGSEAAGTVRFALDGTEYEIDLSTAHDEALHTALGPYVAHARRIGRTVSRATRGATATGTSAVDTHAVRSWAKEQGIDIKDRGRVPAEIIAKYREAAGQ